MMNYVEDLFEVYKDYKVTILWLLVVLNRLFHILESGIYHC